MYTFFEYMFFVMVGVLFVEHEASLSPHLKDLSDKWTCVPINIDICKDIPYNVTIEMSKERPNPYTFKTSQESSKSELDHFKPLLKTNCSKLLRLLLCSVYVPFCSKDIRHGITACRYLCEKVESECSGYLVKFGHKWPDNLNCSKFPKENSEKTPCSDGGLSPPQPVTTTVTTTAAIAKPKTMKPSLAIPKYTPKLSTKLPSPQTYCRMYYSANIRNYIFVKKIQACALECSKDGLFTVEEKQSAEKWLMVLGCVCGLLCLLSLLTVSFDFQETCYPERSIVFITICYSLYSLAHIIRIVYSREEITCQEENGRNYLLVDGSANISCALTFLLAYCFSMVQSIWWVILCLSWFLSAGMKWTADAIKSKSFFFHVIAWGLPCVKTVVILVWRKIDVNELTGICSVGNRYENLRALRWLVLAPLFIYLIMGTMFLFSGLISLFRLQSHRQEQITSRKKLKQFLLPVGGYAALHTIFSTVILATYFYEYVNKNSWYHDPSSSGPKFEIFIIRIIIDFVIGITAALWLLLIHGPRLYQKIRVKLYHTDLLLPKQSIKSHTDTNETSI